MPTKTLIRRDSRKTSQRHM